MARNTTNPIPIRNKALQRKSLEMIQCRNGIQIPSHLNMSNMLSPESWSAGLIYMEKNSSNCLVPNIWPNNRQKRQEIQKKHLPDLETINENESEDFDFYQDLPDIMDFDEFNRIFNKDQF